MPAFLLHTAHEVSWSSWHLAPSIIGGALIVAGLYIYALALPPTRIALWQPVCFFLGSALMFLALVSPLDAAAHRLLSFHMLQHVFLTTIGPPLVLLGISRPMGERLFRVPLLGALLGVASRPMAAAPLFIVNMWVWHVPIAYELALDNLGVHIAMHVAFMATGLLFWWPIIEPAARRSPTSEGAKLLYLFVTGFPMGLLALLLLASDSVLYSAYETGEHLWGVSPIEDQQIAGVIMGALGESASFVAITLLFFRFLDRDEAAEKGARERFSDAA